MSDRYVLRGRKPVKVEDLFEWAREFENGERCVAETTVGGSRVSTVFLGLDHSWGSVRPSLFETMIFGGEHDDYCDRYATWEEAEAGHAKAVKMVTGGDTESG